MSKTYLLEIGTEEIPARVVGDALLQLKNNCIKILNENQITYETIEVYSTPRRLSLIINGLNNNTENLVETVKGPSKKISYDKDGNPTKALLGFMRGQNVELSDTSIQDFNGEEYVYAKVVKQEKAIEEVLNKEMITLIKSINFPKSMKWGGKNLKFARPIRWIVSLLDSEVVHFNLEGIESSNITKGHRFLGSQHILIEDVTDYKNLLRENFVILDGEERKEIIKYGSEKLAKEKGGNLHIDNELLDEVTNILEYPTPMIGRIKVEYLKLPPAIIITPMKEHLRFFPVFDDKNRLLPYFISIRNGNDEYTDIVIKGNEKVLGARLEDAKFFYEDDISKPLEDYVEKLKTITFQERLGSLYDKTNRIVKLSEKIGEYLEVGEETSKNIGRAGFLSKADLVTKIVSEFTELQGKMGKEYALISGENEIVSLAICEQYLPRFSGDELPSTTAGAILSIGDKLDSIAGLFAIGIQPTGSQDPFALRRAALGIINIILDKKLNLSLKELIDFALYIYVEENGLAFDYDKVKNEIMDFFVGRIRNMFSDLKIRYDIIDAVLSAESDDIYDMKIRANKLNEWLGKEDLHGILETFNRVSTLARDFNSTEVKRDLLSEDEIELYDSYNNIELKVLGLIEKKEYDKALDLLSTLSDPISDYFEKVMVMVEDEELKNNRLALLRKIYNTMMMVGDLSKIISK
jgi:glycyl-tRNA synthetase beta chain